MKNLRIGLPDLSFIYLITQIFFTPFYKFLEVYYDYPYLNIAIIRATLSITIIYIFLKNLIQRKLLNNVNLWIILPPFLALFLIWIRILLSIPFGVLSYTPDSTEFFLLRIDTVFFGYPAMFITGIFILKKNPKSLEKYFFIFWLILASLLIMNFQKLIDSYFVYDDRPERTMNYIFLSTHFAVISLISFSLSNSNFRKLLIFIISLIILFLVPSRSVFLCFIFSILTLYLANKGLKLKTIILFSILSMAAGIIIKIISDDRILSANRLIETDLSNDKSLDARLEFQKINGQNLKNTFVFGDFMGDIKIHGEDGKETHNYQSFLEQFGIFPFSLLLISIFQLLSYIILNFRVKYSPLYLMKSLVYFNFPLILLAQGFQNNLVWFLIGLMVYIKREKRIRRTFTVNPVNH